MFVLDVKTLLCPMPIIKLKKYLAQNRSLDMHVLMEVQDRGAIKDVPAFCQQQKLHCELIQVEPVIQFKISRQE